MMVYLKPDTSEAGRLDTKYRLQSIAGVQVARFFSKEDAIEKLKSQMQHHAALLDNLRENPMPDAFEVIIEPTARNGEELSFLAERKAPRIGPKKWPAPPIKVANSISPESSNPEAS